jgi:hypothetical protein
VVRHRKYAELVLLPGDGFCAEFILEFKYGAVAILFLADFPRATGIQYGLDERYQYCVIGVFRRSLHQYLKEIGRMGMGR